MEIDDDPAGCYSGDLRMHIVPRNTVRGLDGKRTKEGKQELLGAGQPLRVVCSQEGAYEALEEQRRDGVARNGIGCTFVPRAANGASTYNPSALPFRIGSDFHCFHVYNIPSQFYSTMAAVDMTSIHFYQPPPAVSPRPSLKPPSLGNAGGKCTATIQCDRLNNLFKTNRRIEPTLQSKLAEDTRAGDEGIVEIQRHEKLI
jgi:hypothetical protein